MLDALTDREKYPAWFVADRSPLYLYDKHKKELYKNCPNVSGIKKKTNYGAPTFACLSRGE